MFRKQSRPARNRFGVSLIEALLVVLILSATATAAIFKMSLVKTVDPARQSAQSFVAMLNTARELAITKQSTVTVTLEQKSTPARWVFAAAASQYGPASQWDLPLEGSADVSGTTTPIRLDGAGNASYFGEWKIQGTNGYYVALEPIGARVTLKPLN